MKPRQDISSDRGPLEIAAVLEVTKQGNEGFGSDDSWRADRRGIKFAVSDGAGEGVYSDLWSQILTSKFVESPVSLFGLDYGDVRETIRILTTGDFLGLCSREWIANAIAPEDASIILKNKIQDGTAATLLALEAANDRTEEGQVRWRSLAVGDSCLFKIRRGVVDSTFPITKCSDFPVVPHLVHTNEAPVSETIQTAEGTLGEGEFLLLCTDAISRWILCAKPDVSGIVRDLLSEGESSAKVRYNEYVCKGVIGNDDLTLACLRITRPPKRHWRLFHPREGPFQ